MGIGAGIHAAPQSLATTDSPTFAGLTLTGALLAPAGSASAPSLALSTSADSGLYWQSGSNGLCVSAGGSVSTCTRSDILRLGSGVRLGWASGSAETTGDDLSLSRDAANALAQRNGTSAQAFRLYNTFTDASNYERLAVEWSSNVAYLRAQAAGTGTLRDLHVYAAEFRQQGANGQYAQILHLTESHTLAAAATSDTTIQIPAGAMVLGVDIRVTTEITGCTSLDVGVTGATTRYGTGIALTAGTTNATCATVSAPTIYQSATAIRFSAIGGGASFTAGVVRVTVHLVQISAATS